MVLKKYNCRSLDFPSFKNLESLYLNIILLYYTVLPYRQCYIRFFI
jgi:hypothetical protein